MFKDWSPAKLEAELVKHNDESAALGPQWALAQGEADSIEDRKNDILASIIEKTEVLPTESRSIAQRQQRARCTEEWKKFKESLSQHRKKALELKIRYQVSVRAWETARSLLSSKNAERRTGT